MGMIDGRKSEAVTGPHRLQEHSDLHENAGTKSTTSTRDAKIRLI